MFMHYLLFYFNVMLFALVSTSHNDFKENFTYAPPVTLKRENKYLLIRIKMEVHFLSRLYKVLKFCN